MAITEKEVLEVIGFQDLEKFEDPASFKQAYDQKFISRDRINDDEKLVNSIFGRKIGSLETDIKSEFKKNGVEFDDGELKDKKLLDITRIAVSKLVSNHSSEVENLKKLSTGKGDEAFVKELESLKGQLDRATGETSQYKEMNEKLALENDNLKTGFDTEKKGWHIDQQTNTMLESVKYKTAGIPDAAQKLVRAGFENELKAKYKFGLDENSKLSVLNIDGTKVEDPKTSGKILGPNEVMKNLAVEKGIWEDNPNAGRKPQTMHLSSSQEAKPQRELHPSRTAS